MNKIYRYVKKGMGVLVCALAVLSCERLVLVDSPANAVDSKILFSTKKGYEGAVAGMYQSMQAVNLSLTNGGLPLYLSLAADELIPRSNNANYQAFYQNVVQSSSSVVSNFWVQPYDGIYRANILLENLADDDVLEQSVADDFKGQALFVRAFYYLYLSQLFGDVPLVLDTDYRKNAVMPRTDLRIVRQQVLDDLRVAVALISKAGRTDRAVPDYYAVLALTARASLLTEEYPSAVEACSGILDEGDFILEEVDKVFKIGSREVIWQLTSEYRNVTEARSFVPANTTSLPLFYMPEHFLSIFSAEDRRRSAWINQNVVAGVTYAYPFKYRDRNNAPVTEYNIVCRLAEIYLIRAEARNKMGDHGGALQDLNAIRLRAGLGALAGLGGAEIDRYIEEERRKEFFAEWGHRWLDLKRWSKIDAALEPVKPSWEPHAALLPVPYVQRLSNVFLEQNPGYHE